MCFWAAVIWRLYLMATWKMRYAGKNNQSQNNNTVEQNVQKKHKIRQIHNKTTKTISSFKIVSTFYPLALE